MTEYRAIRPGEWDEAMELWVGVFNVGGWLFQSLHEGTTGRSCEHTRVAVQDGKIVSAVDVFLRDIRGIDGAPQRVGAIGSVATLDSARRQGHSGRLLQDAIALMEREGCVWSFLFTGVPEHYARFGWKHSRMSSREGKLRDTPLATDPSIHIRRENGNPPLPLGAFSSAYDDFNRTRPLSHVRTDLYWETAIESRLLRPERRIWAAFSGETLVGYAFASFTEEELCLLELCVLHGAENTIGNLMETVRAEAIRAGLSKAEICVPKDDRLQPSIEAAFSDIVDVPQPWAMVRPISASMTDRDLELLFEAPGAKHYKLDAF